MRMSYYSGLLLCLFLLGTGLFLPQNVHSKSLEEMNEEFESRAQTMFGEFEQNLDRVTADYEARQRERNQLFETFRDKVMGLFGNDPDKAKKAVWQGEEDRKGRKEVELEPSLRVEVANYGQGKIEVTAVTVPEADTQTARRQATRQAQNIAAHKLAERVRKIIKTQAPGHQIDEKRVTRLVESSLKYSESKFVRDRAPGQQALCYVKAKIPIFKIDSSGQESSVESIIKREIPKPDPPKIVLRGHKLTYIRKPARKGPCTGLIVDAKGKSFTGKPLIRIFSEDNIEDPIYSVLFIQERDAGTDSMYGHSANLDKARSVNRVTNNPIVLPAKKVLDGCDIILSQEDAYALTVANFNDFLSRARVIVIYEGD